MVRLKWGMEYKGYLVSTDGYMNLQVRLEPQEEAKEDGADDHSSLQLANTEEYQDGVSVGSLGEVFIRCVHCSALDWAHVGGSVLTPPFSCRCNNVLQCAFLLYDPGVQADRCFASRSVRGVPESDA